MLPDDDKRYAIETCRSSESVLKKWFKINYIQLVHLLVLWYLVNLQDARCNNKAVCCVSLLQLFRTVRSIPLQGRYPHDIQTRTERHAQHPDFISIRPRVRCFQHILISCNVFIFINLFIRQKCIYHTTGFNIIHALLHGHIRRSSVFLFLEQIKC